VFSDLSRKETKAILRYFAHSLDSSVLNCIDRDDPVYIEPLLMSLGAKHVTAIDISPYEGATVLHDMNLPISDKLKTQFSVVVDGGTLEHVFAYHQALKNAMEMVKIGGHFLTMTTCNNFMGHGFYQFSPELFFRAFSDANGFVLEHMFACESSGTGRWYRVSDPKIIGQRVELINNCPTYLLIQARRQHDMPIFAALPQQSDYSCAWSSKTVANGLRSHRVGRSLAKQIIPKVIRRRIRNIMMAHRSCFKNRKAFQLVDFKGAATS
jgi:hypothetical protein